MSFQNSGVALITVIIFVILISLVAIASINLMAGQALLIEHQIKRIQAYYANEAALNYNFLRLFTGSPVETPTLIGSRSINCTQTSGTGPLGTSSVISKQTY
ncbi:MAG: pilus assembly PilX N-terminal domain-containing protein [Candidatus Omnitrophota bacterium]|nr:pilus assembly PilX N-terminal domain-containing protein [Candidatus Omnitrophota bacterium]